MSKVTLRFAVRAQAPARRHVRCRCSSASRSSPARSCSATRCRPELRRRCSPTRTPAPTSSCAARSDIDSDYDAARGVDRRVARRRDRATSTASPRSRPTSTATASILGTDGDALGGNGPPTLAGSWIDDPDLNPYQLAEGARPAAADEVVINRGAAKDGDLHVGDTTLVSTPEPLEVTIVGHRDVRRRGRARQRHDRVLHARRRRSSYITDGPTRSRASSSRADDGVSQDGAARRGSSRSLPDGVEAITGADRTHAGHRRPSATTSSTLQDVPGRLRRHRAARRRVQHPQHVLDPRRAADARVGAAAGDRRVAPPGPHVGHGRSVRRSASSPRSPACSAVSGSRELLKALFDALRLRAARRAASRSSRRPRSSRSSSGIVVTLLAGVGAGVEGVAGRAARGAAGDAASTARARRSARAVAGAAAARRRRRAGARWPSLGDASIGSAALGALLDARRRRRCSVRSWRGRRAR